MSNVAGPVIGLKRGDRVALLTSGGDAPGMNAALRAAAKVGAGLELDVVGVEEGYKGLMEGRVRALDLRALDEAARRGGTLLGTARSKVFPTEAGRTQAQQAIAAAGIAGIVVLGGNGSLTGARSLVGTACHDGRPLSIVGIPASIDNDLGCTALSIGVDTAMNTIVEACDRIADTALSHQRTFIIEVMGRDCGYLAMAAGIAAAADAVLFPESGKGDEAIVEQVMRAIESAYARQAGRRHVLVLKSEGVKMDSMRLKQAVDARLGDRFPDVDTRVTVLGHVVRGGSPSAFDRMLAARLGNAAIRALVDGHSDVMAGWAPPGKLHEGAQPSAHDPHVALWPLAQVLVETAKLQSGASPLTRWRVAAFSQAETILYK
jgi:6-phosphofructokinase 1